MKLASKDKIRKYTELAQKCWPILTERARNNETISYQDIAKSLDIHYRWVGTVLDPIQEYCRLNNLKPLTVLVVRKSDGHAGDGFCHNNLTRQEADRKSVYEFDWDNLAIPTVDEFIDAYNRGRPGEHYGK
jgi:hypothetical protein